MLSEASGTANSKNFSAKWHHALSESSPICWKIIEGVRFWQSSQWSTVDGSEIRRTTWDVKNPVNNGRNYLSTCQPDFFHQRYGCWLFSKYSIFLSKVLIVCRGNIGGLTERQRTQTLTNIHTSQNRSRTSEKPCGVGACQPIFAYCLTFGKPPLPTKTNSFQWETHISHWWTSRSVNQGFLP